MDIVIYCVTGLLAGLFSGMFGVGGGIVIIPFLMYFAQFDQLKANGTSIASIMVLPVGLLAAMNYYKNGNVDIKAAAFIIAFLVIGSYISSAYVKFIPPGVLRVAFGALMVLVGIKTMFGK